MENKAHLGNLPREIIEMLLHYLSDQSYTHLAQLQLINKNWKQPAQAQLYSKIDFTRQNFAFDQMKLLSFLYAVAFAPSKPGKLVKYLKLTNSNLKFLELMNDTPATLRKFGKVFPNLEHFVNDGNGDDDNDEDFRGGNDYYTMNDDFEEFDQDLQDKYAAQALNYFGERQEKQAPYYVDIMWDNLEKYNRWCKLKELPHGCKQLSSYGQAANARAHSLEILDFYYPYKALDDDSKRKVFNKKSYCEWVLDRLHVFTNMKHLKSDVDPKCVSVDMEELDSIIDNASIITTLSLIHPKDPQDEYKPWRQRSSIVISVTKIKKLSPVVPQRNIKVLKNDLDMIFTDAATRYFMKKFPALEKLSMSRFLWEKDSLSTKALDAFSRHIARNVKKYYIKSCLSRGQDYWKGCLSLKLVLHTLIICM